jgi:hypothetical protein
MPTAAPQHAGRPVWWTRRLIELAAFALPRACRDRYRREFLAEVYGVSRAGQASYALHVLAYSVPLRFAVRSGRTSSPLEGIDMSRRARRPLRCRLNIRHHWVGESADDGTRYLRCRRCGKDETGKIDDAEGFLGAHTGNMIG